MSNTDLTSLVAHHEIQQTLYNYAEITDQNRFKDWYGLFTEDGVYSAILFVNLEDGLTQFTDRGQSDLKERAAFWMGMWQTDRAKLTHCVSNIQIKKLEGSSATVRSCFHSYRTTDEGDVALYAVGEYRDELVKSDGKWKFKERVVVLDCATLPASFTDPY